jgi:peptidyl-prolyl cis-trans isomerase C
VLDGLGSEGIGEGVTDSPIPRRNSDPRAPGFARAMRHTESEGNVQRYVMVAATFLMVMAGGMASEAGSPPGGEADDNPVVARVNQVDIRYRDFTSRLEALQRERGPIPPEQRGELLRGLVKEELLVQGAVAEGLEQDAVVKGRLELTRRQILIDELLKRKVLETTRVTEQETRKMYEDSKALFTTETFGVSHILVKTEAEGEAILQELKAGKDFAELAKARSQDTGSADKGGDLGAISRGQTTPEFEEAALALKEGELSPVVKTEYGYHILKGGARGSVVQPYDEVKDRVRQMALDIKRRDAFLAYMTDLEKRAKADVFEDRLR